RHHRRCSPRPGPRVHRPGAERGLRARDRRAAPAGHPARPTHGHDTMSHPDMLEGPDAPTLSEDAGRYWAWRRVEDAHRALHRATNSVDRVRALCTYQTELTAFSERYWTDMRRAFGGLREARES